MPLADVYKEQIKSPIADLKNLGAPDGGVFVDAFSGTWPRAPPSTRWHP